jgi:hypothetical protein
MHVGEYELVCCKQNAGVEKKMIGFIDVFVQCTIVALVIVVEICPYGSGFYCSYDVWMKVR